MKHMYIWWLLGIVIILLIMIIVLLIIDVNRHHVSHKKDFSSVIGKKGYVMKAINLPNLWLIEINGQYWEAYCKEKLSHDDHVVVTATYGFILIIQKMSDSI